MERHLHVDRRNLATLLTLRHPENLHEEKSMDPITTAILAALPAIASNLVSSTVKDSYAALKAVIRRRWGDASPIAKSVDDLEANPKSKGRSGSSYGKCRRRQRDTELKVMQVLTKLVDELKRAGVGTIDNSQMIANISGGEVGVGVAQSVSIGSMNIGTARTRD